MFAENIRRAAAVGTAHDRDRQVREIDAGICGSDGRIVPAGDTREENVGVHRPRQPERRRDIGQIVGHNDFAGRNRQQDHAALHLGDLLVGHCRIAAGEVHGAVDEIANTGAAAFGLVVDDHAVTGAAVVLEPRRVDRIRKACPGAGQTHLLGRSTAACDGTAGEQNQQLMDLSQNTSPRDHGQGVL